MIELLSGPAAAVPVVTGAGEIATPVAALVIVTVTPASGVLLPVAVTRPPSVPFAATLRTMSCTAVVAALVTTAWTGVLLPYPVFVALTT